MSGVVSTSLGPLAVQRIEAVLAAAQGAQRLALRANVLRALDTLASLAQESSHHADRAQSFQCVLGEILQRVNQHELGGREPAGAGDHDYGDMLKLCRSVQFSWGPWTSEKSHAAFGPHMWALNQLLTHVDRHAACRVQEIGCGTGSLGYALRTVRPGVQVDQAEPSLESLVMAALIQSGEPLVLPRRVSFDRDPAGIGWFAIHVPAIPDGLFYQPWALPEEGGALDVVVAINSLSLSPNPLSTARSLASRLQAHGLFLWVDLFCWRLETPAPRRLRGPDAMAQCLMQCGFDILSEASGIPYLEDWGHEREYRWTSHGVLARKR